MTTKLFAKISGKLCNLKVSCQLRIKSPPCCRDTRKTQESALQAGSATRCPPVLRRGRAEQVTWSRPSAHGLWADQFLGTACVGAPGVLRATANLPRTQTSVEDPEAQLESPTGRKDVRLPHRLFHSSSFTTQKSRASRRWLALGSDSWVLLRYWHTPCSFLETLGQR